MESLGGWRVSRTANFPLGWKITGESCWWGRIQYWRLPGFALDTNIIAGHGCPYDHRASGINPVTQMQIQLNGKDIYHVAGQTLSTNLTLPAESSDKLVVQAIDSKGVTPKFANTIAGN